MQKRIGFLLVVTMGVILASLGVISYLRVQESIRISLEHRLALANMVGRYVDHVLESNLKRLYDISLSGRIDFRDGDFEPERKALRAAAEYSIFTERILLLDKHGRVVIAHPHGERDGGTAVAAPWVIRTLSDQKPVISDVETVERTRRRVIYAMVPLKDRNGEVVGVACGEIDPTNYLLFQIIAAIPAAADTYIELIDSRGVIIASNDPRRILSCGERYRILHGLIEAKSASVLSCHRCKENLSQARRGRDMLAFSPLSAAPWGVIVRDPEESVFFPSTRLRKGFIVLSVISILTAALLAAGLSRGIVRPIRSLIQASRRIAEGNLWEPVEVAGDEEIGALSRSFDEMRVKLAESLESIRRANVELERRVAERTAELERSREKLALLLRGIINAEEEERKRIARELHDDTSQSLNATLIALDAVSLQLPPDGPAQARIAAVREQCMAMLKGIHRTIKDLRPPVLDDLGLASAIKWVLEKHIGERGIPFTFSVEGDAEEIKARAAGGLDFGRIELVLFRICQEAIINVSRHAEAKSVAVFLAFGEKGISMEIRDDGKGFDVRQALESVKKDGRVGLGLLGMEERVALLSGRLTVWSEPGRGTRINVHVPVPA